MTFDQESRERLHFDRDHLKIVVAQVRFPNVLALADPAVQRAIQAEISQRFPVALSPVQEIVVSLTAEGPQSIQTQMGAIRFGDAEDARTIVSVAPGLATLETARHDGWDAFWERFEFLLGVIGRHAQPKGISRFGLRYVNEIAIDGVVTVTDWEGAIQMSLLGADDSLARDPRAVRTQQRVIIKPTDEDVVNVVHGYVRNAQPDAGPASIYVLDVDAFSEIYQAWDIAALARRGALYHTWMTNIFVRSLTEEGIGLMGGTVR